MTSLSRFWEVRGHWSEGLRWFEQVLAQTVEADDRMRAPALVSASFLAFYRGRLESAREMVDEGLSAARRVGDEVTEARGLRFAALIQQRLGTTGLIFWHEGTSNSAIENAENAVALSRSGGEPADLAFALQVLGRFLIDERRDEARALSEEGLVIARRAEDAVSSIYLLYSLGQMSIRDGDNERARNLFSEALELSQKVGERWMATNVLVGLAQVSEEVDAGPAIEEMVGLQRQIGNRMMLMAWLRQLAYRRRLEGDLAGARRSVDEVLELAKQEGTPEAQALSHYILGAHLDEAEGDYAGALVEFAQGLRLAYALGSKWETALGLSRIGGLLAVTGESERAAVVLGAAQKLRATVGMPMTGARAERYNRFIEVLERDLGESERERLWAKGSQMSEDDAVNLATEVGTSFPSNT